jgi:hypothetical protein
LAQANFRGGGSLLFIRQNVPIAPVAECAIKPKKIAP